MDSRHFNVSEIDDTSISDVPLIENCDIELRVFLIDRKMLPILRYIELSMYRNYQGSIRRRGSE